MRRATGKRVKLSRLVALAALLLVAVVSPLEQPSAWAAATLTVDPSVGLIDGQEVTVTGSGVTEISIVAVCRVGLDDATAQTCAFAQEFAVVSPDTGGLFTTTLRVPALVDDGTTITDCRSAACEAVLLEFSSDLGSGVVRARQAVTFDPGGPLVAAPIVSVTPSGGLIDGQMVHVNGTGFDPDGWVSVSQCATDGADSGCRYLDDLEPAPSGVLDVDVRLRATIAFGDTPGDRIDCRSATTTCEVRISGGSWRDPAPVPVSFDPSAPLLPPPTLAVDPSTDLVDGQTVQFTGSGFQVDEVVSVFQCGPTTVDGGTECRSSLGSTLLVDGSGSVAGPVRLRTMLGSWSDDPAEAVDCRLVTCTLTVGSDGEWWTLPLSFDPGAPLLPPPSVSVDPTTDLVDGQVVDVTLTNFDPDGWGLIELCRVGSDSCDPATSTYVEIELVDPTVAQLQVYGTFATYTDWVDCRVAPGCEIRVTDGMSYSIDSVPVSFGPPPVSRGRFIDPVFDDVDVRHDVVYRTTTDHLGRTVDLKMDIYQPVGDTLARRPVVMWMHGGWFIFGDKSSISPYAEASARRGYVGVSLQYRLRPDISTSDLAAVVGAARDARVDAAAAVDWLAANADDLRIDPRAIMVGGYSAGGVLSWNLAYPDEAQGERQPGVAAAAPIAGVPFAWPEPGDPPVIGFHAANDDTVPPSGGREKCAAAVYIGLVCRWNEYPDGGHGIVSSRFRDIVERSHLFFYDQVLMPLGYDPGTGPEKPPSERPRPTVTVPPSTFEPPSTTKPTGSTTTEPTASTSVPGLPGSFPTTTTPTSSTSTVPGRPGLVPAPVFPAAPAQARSGRPSFTG